MSQIVIAKRYAKALFHLAEKGNAYETVGQDLAEFTQTFADSEELQNVLADTKISSLLKREIVNKILAQLRPTPLVQTFVQYLLSKKRIFLLADIEKVFSSLVREKLGRLDAEITVAKALSESRVFEITQKLSQFSGKDVHVDVKVDPEIIGGVVTRIGSVVIDGSLRHQLTRVYQSIIRG